MIAPVSQDDPVWAEALDWLLRVQAAPADRALLTRRDQWLARAPAHARAYGQAEEVWRLTGRVAPAFPFLTPQALCRQSAPPAGRRRRAWATAAGLALAACVALVLFPGLSLRLRADQHTGTGEIRTVHLADGSTVVLDADSAITVRLGANKREIGLLSGRAFFQVAADASRPFTVSADDVEVTVTGTAFDVATSGDDTMVSVQSGHVAVAVTRPGHPANARLERGQRARLSHADGGLRIDSVPMAQIGLWRDRRLVVNGATIAQVVAQLSHYAPGLIVVRDPALAGRRVTGVFDLSDPRAALEAVLQPHGGVVRDLSPLLHIVSSR